MCWSEEVSWLTWFIGTIITTATAVKFQDHKYIPALCVGWQISVVNMQLWEALVWHTINYMPWHTINDHHMVGTYGAVFTALLQPPLMGIVLIVLSDTRHLTFWRKKFAFIILVLYIYWYSYSIATISPLKQLTVLDPATCNHIHFDYWTDLFYPDLIYSTTISSLFILLIDRFDLAILLIGLSGFNYTVTYLLYNCGESNGSMWCWLSSITMGLVGFYEYFATLRMIYEKRCF